MRHIQSVVMNHVSRIMYSLLDSLHASLFQTERKSPTTQHKNSLINYGQNQ